MDDDNYVNTKVLLKLLKAFPQTLDVYIGWPRLNWPIHSSEPPSHNHKRLVQFWFTTGGGGFCNEPQSGFENGPVGQQPCILDKPGLIQLSDDCTVGYIIECKPSPLFHGHLETLQLLRAT